MEWIEVTEGIITQGSIVEGVDWGFGNNNPPLSIVLSNACDLENGKCSYLIVLALVEASSTLRESREFISLVKDANTDGAMSKKQWKSLVNFFEGYIHNKNVCRYYFMDLELIEAPLMLADFQLIQSIPYEKVVDLKKVAQLKSPFKEQMIVHFSAYTSRIPSDRVTKEKSDNYIDDLAMGYRLG